MCCRFMRQTSLQALAGWFDVELVGIPFFASSYNIAPQSVQPVVRLNPGSGIREFAMQRWGLVPFWVLLANSRTAFLMCCRLSEFEVKHPIETIAEWPLAWLRTILSPMQFRSASEVAMSKESVRQRA